MTDGIHDTKGHGANGWFPHERLDVFHASLEFAAWVQAVRRKICEGAGRSGGSRGSHFEIAYGSAAECHGAVCLLRARGVSGTDQALHLLHRIRRMLAGLH